MCTELLEMFADEELVDNYLSDNEKKPSLRRVFQVAASYTSKQRGIFRVS